MTIKDIFNTPISQLWGAVSPFVTVYFIVFGILFLATLSFIIYVFVKIIKANKEFDKKKGNQFGIRKTRKF